MEDPVLACDGHTYERKALKTWLEQSDRSPLTNAPLRHNDGNIVLMTNGTVKKLIHDFFDRYNATKETTLHCLTNQSCLPEHMTLLLHRFGIKEIGQVDLLKEELKKKEKVAMDFKREYLAVQEELEETKAHNRSQRIAMENLLDKCSEVLEINFGSKLPAGTITSRLEEMLSKLTEGCNNTKYLWSEKQRMTELEDLCGIDWNRNFYNGKFVPSMENRFTLVKDEVNKTLRLLQEQMDENTDLSSRLKAQAEVEEGLLTTLEKQAKEMATYTCSGMASKLSMTLVPDLIHEVASINGTIHNTHAYITGTWEYGGLPLCPAYTFTFAKPYTVDIDLKVATNTFATIEFYQQQFMADFGTDDRYLVFVRDELGNRWESWRCGEGGSYLHAPTVQAMVSELWRLQAIFLDCQNRCTLRMHAFPFTKGVGKPTMPKAYEKISKPQFKPSWKVLRLPETLQQDSSDESTITTAQALPGVPPNNKI